MCAMQHQEALAAPQGLSLSFPRGFSVTFLIVFIEPSSASIIGFFPWVYKCWFPPPELNCPLILLTLWTVFMQPSFPSHQMSCEMFLHMLLPPLLNKTLILWLSFSPLVSWSCFLTCLGCWTQCLILGLPFHDLLYVCHPSFSTFSLPLASRPRCPQPSSCLSGLTFYAFSSRYLLMLLPDSLFITFEVTPPSLPSHSSPFSQLTLHTLPSVQLQL